MSDTQTQLAQALKEAGEQWCEEDDEDNEPPLYGALARAILSMPNIAVVDLSNIDPVAAAIAKNWPDSYARSWPWDTIPERDQEAYRQDARNALLAAARAAQSPTGGVCSE